MPKKVSKGSDYIEYVYLANGEKLAKKKNGQFVNFCCGSFVYKSDKSLEYIAHDEGLVLKEGSSFSYQYNLTDHLGNVRNVLDASNVSIQSNDYYPFGLTHTSPTNFVKNKYLYNGKEAQDETIGGTVFNLLDYGARLYDPVIGDWRNVDPLAEKSRRWSPYTYCFNNPLRFIDPDGMSTWVVKNEDDTYQVINGDLNDNDHNIYVYTQNEKGQWVRGESIGVTTSITSFYNDSKDKETGEAYGWMGTINTNDNSGEKFLEGIFTSTPPLGDYIAQAGNGEPLDFKSKNAPGDLKNDKQREEYYYRGTYVGELKSGVTGKTYKTYTSARDVGNIAAGYVAGANGISWKEATVLINSISMQSQSHHNQTDSGRYMRGWNKLQEIDGEAGEKVVNGLKDVFPDLGRFIIEYSFGDVYSLPLLDNKSKEIAAVASLIAQRAVPEMKVHFNGALNSGCTITEVKELVLHMSAYVGFPKTICAMNTLKEVLAERKSEGIEDQQGKEAITDNSLSRYERGSEYLSRLNENQEQIMKETYDNFSPELVRFVIEYGYGDIYARESLDKRYRQIVTIAALTTLGNAPSQLNFHIHAGLNVGLTIEDIKEIMLMMSVYAGFPAAINGINALRDVAMNLN